MENKIKKLLVGTGLLIGAVVALSPLTSYAEGDKIAAQKDRATKVSLTIDSFLQLAAVSSTKITADYDNVVSGKIFATVISSTDYAISLSAAQPNLIHATNNTYSIPASNNIVAGTNGWGVKKQTAGATGYSAVTTTPQVFYEGEATTMAEKTELEVGVGTSSGLAAGTYSTVVTVTAAAK